MGVFHFKKWEKCFFDDVLVVSLLYFVINPSLIVQLSVYTSDPLNYALD